MRALAVGAALWVVATVAAIAGVGELTLVESLLLLAVLVIVPAAAPLPPLTARSADWVAVMAGVPVAPALLVEQGPVAASLSLPWLGAAAVGALAAASRWWRGERRVRDLVWVAAAAYLVVGAAWLVADRLDVEPAGFAAPFVQLTAVHFHYAGFASAVLAGCAWGWQPKSRLAAAAAVLTVVTPPIVAVGFTFFSVLQIAGAVLLTAGLWLLAWITIRHVAPRLNRLARTLLVASSVAVLVPMVLAVQWAVGANYGTPALSIPDMARTHGVVNAAGFTLLGVVGWRLAHRDRAPGTT